MISVIASSTFTVEDTFSKVNVYRATETSAGATNAGITNGLDGEIAAERIASYLAAVAKISDGMRSYFCFTDVQKGWSKTIPGVNEIITSYR